MARIFVDLDGVLTDFDAQFQTWFGLKVEVSRYKTDFATRQTVDAWLATASENFWAEMPWLAGAQDFWREVAPLGATILSSPHFAPACVPGKRRWVESRLGSDVRVILDTDKGAHSVAGDILIDDSPSNAQGWNGRFILHRSWPETRKKFQEFS